jgi:replicative DNA helicase
VAGPDRSLKDETLADWLEERGKELETTYGLKALGIEPDTHCPTGLRRLDDAGLLELGVATIVLGHEGDGKSSLGLQFLEGCARGGYHAIGFWPEDPKRFVSDRVFSPLVGESAARLRRCRVDDVSGIPARLRQARTESANWTSRIGVCDRRLTSKQAIAELKRRWTPNHRLVVFDYAQVFGDHAGSESSITQNISEFVWDANEFAKDHNAAVVILSQVRREVKERGRKLFDDWKFRNQNKPPTAEAVEGYRPLSGDGHYAPSALGQKARSALSWFRPHLWLREHGADVKDDVCEAMIIKNNYGETKVTVRLKWNGPLTRISDPRDT